MRTLGCAWIVLILGSGTSAAAPRTSGWEWQLETAVVAQALESEDDSRASAVTATYVAEVTRRIGAVSWQVEVEGSQEITAADGSDLAAVVGSHWSCNELLEDNGMFVALARLMGTSADGALEWQIGKISPKNSMDENRAARSKTTKFIAEPFVKNSAVAFAGKGLGVSVRWKIAPIATLALCLSDANARGTKSGLSTWRGEWYRAMEITWRPRPTAAVRLLSWGTEKRAQTDAGWGVNGEWELAPHLVAFARAGGGSRRFAGSKDLAAAGLAWELPFGRKSDYCGIGWTRGRSLSNGRAERRTELFYRWQINSLCAVSPHVQAFRGEGGAGVRRGWLIGCRLVLRTRG